MLKVFKKKINPLHTLRDYDDQFSSKNDVLSSLSESRLLISKSSPNLSKHLSNVKGNGSMWGSKSNKNNNTTFMDKQQESEDMDDLDSSFRKRKAEFHFHKKTFVFCKRSFWSNIWGNPSFRVNNLKSTTTSSWVQWLFHNLLDYLN